MYETSLHKLAYTRDNPFRPTINMDTLYTIMEKFKTFIISVVTAFFALFGYVTAQSPSDMYRAESFSTGNTPEVVISTSGGRIEVIGNDENSVHVEMYVQRRGRYYKSSDTDLSDYDITIRQDGNRVIATAELKNRGRSWWSGSDNYSVSFKVYAPVGSTIDGRTSGGSVSAENFTGNVNLRTSGGSVTGNQLTGNSELRTSGGSITLKEIKGELDARTSGGSISAEDLEGEITLRTSGGSITIDGSRAAVSARTSGGTIRASISELAGDLDLRTSGGGITINLRDASDFEIDLTGGRVRTELRNFTGNMDRGFARGKIGDGGYMISARTSAGSVTLNY